MSGQLSDAELWQAIVNNDYGAFTALFDKYWSQVYSTAFRHLQDDEACKEITHDIFLNIWLKRSKLQIASMLPYLRAAARYHIFKHLKAIKMAPVSYVEGWEELSVAHEVNAGEQHLIYAELEYELDTQLQELPKRCREIFIMSRKQHLSNDQIAGMLGVSKRTVENQLTHALHHLRVAFRNVTTVISLLLILFLHH